MARHGCVVGYEARGDRVGGHERSSRGHLAGRIARLLGCEHAGDYDPDGRYSEPVYFVPSHTLVGLSAARALGIRSEADLFGGVVPFAFVATKTITHPLVDAAAHVPAGWSHAFPARVRDVVLVGLSAFAHDDALRAGEQMLQRGEVRVKPGTGIGGRNQAVVTTLRELERAVAAIAPDELARCGVVLEENLRDVETYSVGRVRIGEHVASCVGTQRMTRDNRGNEVYGGSDLLVARGDFDALLALSLEPAARLAVTQANIYDTAARELFPGLLASRSNYDIARGTAPDNRVTSGVLEQSWRLGGASSAEIGALEAFAADPELSVVHAYCVECFGTDREPPPDAVVHYAGVDERVGPLLKYAVVEVDGGNTR
jgi:hypothetical protein